MGDGPSVLVTLRISARDRALLEELVERERRSSRTSASRSRSRASCASSFEPPAKAAAVDVAGVEASAPVAPPAPSRRATTPASLRTRCAGAPAEEMAERRGLGAELARKLGVERAQVSRFKAGKEPFPAGKLGGLYTLLTEP